MSQDNVDIIAQNAGEIRLYLAQYWSNAKQRRVQEYADAVPESDLATMSPQDRQKILFYGAENLRPAPSSGCSPVACAACHRSCDRQ